MPPPVTDAERRFAALRASVGNLRGVVEGLAPEQLVAPAYPSEWTIADVLSHLGSGAVIARARLDDVLADRESPEGFAQDVWDAWNAKSPRVKAADALVADGGLVGRLEELTEEEAGRFHLSMGPLDLDLGGYVGLRLNEHALHSWDILVALSPTAVLAPDATELLVDNLEMIARYSGKPIGRERAVHVRTADPVRDFVVTLDVDSVSLAQRSHARPDLEMPAEAFIRLVYGRLDPAHTPPVEGDPGPLDELRRAFPGV